MAIHKRSINSIIREQLTGELTEDDRKRLNAWIESSPENRVMYEQFMSATNFRKRYESYAEIDEQRAWMNFRKEHPAIRSIQWKKVLRYAAMLLLPIAGVIISMWISGRMDFNETLPYETRIAMKRSEQMGKQRATLIFADGEKINLNTPLRWPLQRKGNRESAFSLQENKEKTVSESGNNQLMTLSDSEYWVALEDGTIVHLNYNTTLKYPSHFSSHDRTVYLDGEAYFQVAKEQDRPFRVVTSSGVVTQYGTSFNVNTNTMGCTKVVLVDGSVSVTPQKGEERIIKPGELAVLYSSLPEAEVKSVNVESYVAWNTGHFVFENCTFEELMDVISVWYGKKVIFESDDIRRMLFTGDIDRYSSIIPVLNAIERVTNLEISITEENVILKNRNNIDKKKK